MTPEQLKASVLQYAMQGKLVPQVPTDDPASELIKRIQAEKEQLIKEKKIKKEKPLPEITDEEKPFEIPENWEWIRLRSSGFVTSGGTPKTSISEYWDGDIPWITPADMGKQKGKYLVKSAKKITEIGLSKSSAQLIPSGSIVYSSRAPIGHINIVEFEFTTNQGCKSITPLQIDIEFIYYVLINQTPNISKRGTGTTFKEISGMVFGATVIPIPPLNEQKRIVKKIEELFEKIDQYAESYNKLEELNKQFPIKMEKSLLQYAMQGKLVPQNPSDEPASELLKQIKAEKEQLIKDKKIKKEKPLPEITDEEIPFEIPESWEWVRLGTISEKIHYGYTASAIDKGNSKFVRITDIHNNKVDWDSVPYCNVEKEKMNNLKLSKGDILIARTGGTIGKSFLLPEIKHDAVFASYLIRVKLVNKEMSKFIQLYLNSPLYWGLLSAISFGTGQPNVNATNLSLLTVPIPPSNEQSIISRKVESLFEISRKLN